MSSETEKYPGIPRFIELKLILVQLQFLTLLGRIVVLRTYAAYCYRPSRVVCLSVCRSVTLVSPAKTPAPIEMPFGLWARMGRRNHMLDGGPVVLRDVAMATIFGFLYMGCTLAPPGEYN